LKYLNDAQLMLNWTQSDAFWVVLGGTGCQHMSTASLQIAQGTISLALAHASRHTHSGHEHSGFMVRATKIQNPLNTSTQ